MVLLFWFIFIALLEDQYTSSCTGGVCLAHPDGGPSGWGSRGGAVGGWPVDPTPDQGEGESGARLAGDGRVG